MRDYLEFEKPIQELDERIEKIQSSGGTRSTVQEELRRLKARLAQLEAEVYQRLTPWQRTQLARHPQRPSVLDHVGALCSEFVELHGDRLFGDDRAVVGGFARFGGVRVTHVGQDFMIFDWSYQVDPGNPELSIHGGQPVTNLEGITVKNPRK